MKCYLLLILPLLFFNTLNGQTFISGQVIDKQTKEPLPFANVFIHNSQEGTVTDENGNFEITLDIESVVEIFVSYVGYNTFKKSIFPGISKNLVFELQQSSIVFDEQVIKSKADKEWQKRLKKFENAFIGTDDFAQKCTIENPWILDFYYEKGSFKATTNDQVLIIKNEALGYQINYFLQSFSKNNTFTKYTGLAGYTELEPKSNTQLKKWLFNRAIAYNGSLRHFIKSVMEGQIEENGFEAFHAKLKPGENKPDRFPDKVARVNKDSFFKDGKITFKNFVNIYYHNELSDGKSQNSILQVKKPIKIYSNGEIQNPISMIVRGHMGFEAFANFLPMEYDPNQIDQNSIFFAKKIIRPFRDFIADNPVEKIHIHTDKTRYFPAEKIWLKAYINVGEYSSPISSRLYVQLSNRDNTLIQTILEIGQGTAKGSIDLPDSIADGDYVLTAYTNWSEEMPKAYHFSKKIKIGVADEGVSGISDSDIAYKITLFPEGGNFVSGVNNTFAYEIRDQFGNAVNEKVELISGSKVLKTDSATWQGKGIISFKSKSGKAYFLRIQSDPEHKTPLQFSQEAAVSLSAQKNPVGYQIMLNKNNSEKQDIHYAIIHNNQIIYYKSLSISKEYSFILPEEILNEGTNQLVVFDNSYLPIAERLLFKKPKKNDKAPEFSIDGSEFVKRQKTTVELTNSNDLRDASIAVIDMSQTSESGEENIYISHYLRPWIKGAIGGLEDLSDDSQQKQIELLLLTNGWSRYDWQAIQDHQPKPEREISIDRGFNISGKVFLKDKKSPIAGTPLFLSSVESGFFSTVTDDDGDFSFDNVYYTDSTNLIFKLGTKKAWKDYEFSFHASNWQKPDFPYESVFRKEKTQATVIKENYELKLRLAETYQFDGRTYYLKDAIIKGDKITAVKRDESFYSSPISKKVLIDSVNLGATPTTFNIIERNFPKLIARVEQDAKTLQIRYVIRRRMNLNSFMRLKGQMSSSAIAEQTNLTIFVDNIEIAINELYSINPENIYSIELLDGPAASVLGFESQKGAILVTTRKSLKKREEFLRSDFLLKQLKGYQQFKEFYHPDHAEKQEIYVPDRRSTLYWNPDISVETKTMTYYNHDNPAPIKVIMEGFTTDGKPFRQVGFYEVIE
ncbi:MAG: carboxypeptidase-like regulatory domain-containing protein [Bacteroidota bacterium]